jgi:hypothetical protein
MDGRDQPDTNVVRIRRKGDPSETERKRLASTIFADEDDIGTFSRGNLVPPRPDARDTNQELAPSSDPFLDRLPAQSKADETQRTDPADPGESTDAYFDRLTTQSPAEMSTNGAPTLAAMPMPGSALLPPELARPSRHHGRLRRRLIPPALAISPRAALRRSRSAWLLSTATLAALAALAAGIAVIGESGSPGSERQHSQPGASASPLEPLKPGFLAASANPFSATVLVHRPVSPVHRPHPSNSGHPKHHHAGTPTSTPVHTTVNHHVVAAKYTPTQHTSASVAVTPDTQNSPATRSTRPATPPGAPTHHTSSSNSGSGSSSSSASPSKATLRSLVTGAGTCSCQ